MLLSVLAAACLPALLLAETVRLRSGREIEIIDGVIAEKLAQELYTEGEQLLKKGQLDLAAEHWQWIAEKGAGGVAIRARSAREGLKRIEYGSFVLLKNGLVYRGKVTARLRSDLLGMEGKEEISLSQVEEIVAEYHPGYSHVSKTFYPLTVLEIKLRGQKIQGSRITGEIEFTVESADGATHRAWLGKEYEILRPSDLARELEAITASRIIKVSIYPELKRME